MTAREHVLLGYGSACVWCGSAGPLDIDHVHGGGNQHRAEIAMPLERWLWREYQRLGHWLPGYQLLCTTCHDRKHGRTPRMPTGEGKKAIHLSLPSALVTQLDVLASQPGRDRSQVVTEAVQAHLEGGASATLLHTLHQQIAEVVAALQALEQTVATLTQESRQGRDQLTTLSKDHYRLVDAANGLCDYVDGSSGKRLPAGSRLKQFFGQRH